MVLRRCNVSAKDTHRAQKWKESNYFSWPRYAHAHLAPYLRSTSVHPIAVPQSFSLLCPPHLPLPYSFHSLTPILHSPFDLSHLPFSSPAICTTSRHLILHLCHPHNFFPASVSLPPGHRTPSSLPLCQSSRQTLVHVIYLAIPASIQLNSRWENVEAAKFHRCSAELGLP
jgi:hypothetical protein